MAAGAQGGFLCAAAQQGDVQLLQNLLQYGADIDSPNSDGLTALHVAVAEGWLGATSFLLANGAKADQPDRRGLTPIDLAMHQGQLDLVKLLENPSTSSCDIDQPKSHNRKELELQNVTHSKSARRCTGKGARSTNLNKSIFHLLDRQRSFICQVEDPSPRRITIHSYHPKSPKPTAETAKLIPLPGSWTELIKIASKSIQFSTRRSIST